MSVTLGTARPRRRAVAGFVRTSRDWRMPRRFPVKYHRACGSNTRRFTSRLPLQCGQLPSQARGLDRCGLGLLASRLRRVLPRLGVWGAMERKTGAGRRTATAAGTGYERRSPGMACCLGVAQRILCARPMPDPESQCHVARFCPPQTSKAFCHARGPGPVDPPFTFSDTDLAVIGQRRGPANRLGFAVQLCYMGFGEQWNAKPG